MHADADAFFVSVAQRDDASLRGLPVVVGGGVVIAASYEARRFGVRGGMGGARARRLCPQLVVARSSWEAYGEASRALMAGFERPCPRVERLRLEEAFLHVPRPSSPPPGGGAAGHGGGFPGCRRLCQPAAGGRRARAA